MEHSDHWIMTGWHRKLLQCDFQNNKKDNVLFQSQGIITKCELCMMFHCNDTSCMVLWLFVAGRNTHIDPFILNNK